MLKKKLALKNLIIVLIYAGLLLGLNYTLNITFLQRASIYDGTSFNIAFKGFLVFNFAFNILITIVKWLFLSILLYSVFKVLNADAGLGAAFNICVLSEFIFFLTSINTVVTFWNRFNFGRDDVIKENNYFRLDSVFQGMEGITLLGNINLLNILYFFIAILLISHFTKFSEQRSAYIATIVFVLPWLLKQLLISLFQF